MKMVEEYLARAGEKYQPSNKGTITRETALEAIRACMRDHEKFVDETFEKVDKLIEKIKVLENTISAINGELKRHLGD